MFEVILLILAARIAWTLIGWFIMGRFALKMSDWHFMYFGVLVWCPEAFIYVAARIWIEKFFRLEEELGEFPTKGREKVYK